MGKICGWELNKTEKNLKPELKRKFSEIPVTKNLAGDAIKSANENYFKSSLENF